MCRCKKRQPAFRAILKHCFHKELGITVSISEYSRNKEEDDFLVKMDNSSKAAGGLKKSKKKGKKSEED